MNTSSILPISGFSLYVAVFLLMNNFLIILNILLAIWFILFSDKIINKNQTVIRFFIYFMNSILFSAIIGSTFSQIVEIILLSLWAIKRKASWKKIILSSFFMLTITSVLDGLFVVNIGNGVLGEIHLLPLTFSSANVIPNFVGALGLKYPLFILPLNIPVETYDVIRLTFSTVVFILTILITGKKIWKLSGPLLLLFTLIGSLFVIQSVPNAWSNFKCINKKPITEWHTCPKERDFGFK